MTGVVLKFGAAANGMANTCALEAEGAKYVNCLSASGRGPTIGEINSTRAIILKLFDTGWIVKPDFFQIVKFF